MLQSLDEECPDSCAISFLMRMYGLQVFKYKSAILTGLLKARTTSKFEWLKRPAPDYDVFFLFKCLRYSLGQDLPVKCEYFYH